MIEYTGETITLNPPAEYRAVVRAAAGLTSYDPADYDDDRNNNTGRVLTLRPRLEDEPGARYRVIGARVNPLGQYQMHAVNIDNGRRIFNVTLDDVSTLY